MSLSTAVGSAPATPATVVSGTHLPDGWGMERLAHAEFSHSGQDLRIVDPAGHELLVKGYFLSDTHADLQLDGGMAFRAAWAERLSAGDGRLAQAAGTAAPAPAIGTVKTLNGTVTVEHADGTRATLHNGDAVHQGDVLETATGGAVGIVFLDGSNFSLGANGKMILDEMVYDPASQSGSANVGVLGGTFAFISGQIAKTAPDAMKVTTPSATIGFRGTSGSGEVGGDGQTSIVLIRDPDGTIGEIVLVTSAGVFTLSTVLQAAQVSINPTVPVVVQTMTAAEFTQQYGTVTSHLPAATAGGNAQQFLNQATQGAGQEGQQGQEGNPNQQEGQQDQGLQQLQQQVQQQVQQQIQQQPPAPAADPLVDVVATLIATVTQTAAATTDDTTNNNENLVVETPDGTGGIYTGAGTHTGTEGNDVMTFVGAGNVSFYGLAGNDVLTGYTGNDYLSGGDGNDILYGGPGNDTLLGGDGNDLIVAGSGHDEIDGGAGIDTLDYSSSGTPIHVVHDGTDIHVASAGSVDTAENIEVLIGSSGNDTFSIEGINTDSNIHTSINGGAGNDTFTVEATATPFLNPLILDGGTGTNTLDFSPLTEGITVQNGQVWTTTSGSSSSFIEYSNISVFKASAGEFTFTGGSGDETIYAADTVSTVSIAGGGGTDTVDFSEVTAHSLSVDGSDGIAVTYNSTSTSDTTHLSNIDTIVATDGDDTFTGMAGYGVVAVGGAGDDGYEAGVGDDTFYGGAGDDTVSTADDGAADIDSVFGGEGTDTLDLYGALYGVTLNATTGSASWSVVVGQDPDTQEDILGTHTLHFSEFEAFRGGSDNDSLTGSDQAETFIFSEGDDTFHGEGGGDTAMFAGTSADHISVTGTNAYGLDSLNGTLGTTALYSIETIVGTGGNDDFHNVEEATAFGGDGADTFYASAGANVFNGGDGNDLVVFDGDNVTSNLGGADTFVGGDGVDTIDFSAQTSGDAVSLSYNSAQGAMIATFTQTGGTTAKITEFEEYTLTTLADTFTGSCGADTVNGMDGNDTFYASFGGDTYSGGKDADTLTYANLSGKHIDATLTTDTSSIDILDSADDVVSTDSASLMETLIGTAGDDTFTFGAVNPTSGGLSSVEGGAGDDTFAFTDDFAAYGPVSIDGGSGTNVLDMSTLTNRISVASNVVTGYTGPVVEYSNISVFKASISDFTFTGSSGDETIYIASSSLNATLHGNGGNDTVDFSTLEIDENTNEGISVVNDGMLIVNGVDQSSSLYVKLYDFATIVGSAGDDTFSGTSGHSVIHGGAGDDTYTAGYGNDTFHGGTGDDTAIIGTIGSGDTDTFSGGDGHDTLLTGNIIHLNIETTDGVHYTADQVGGSDGFTFSGFETIGISSGGCTFTGGSGDETVFYQYVSDFVSTDALHGGTGFDVLDFQSLSSDGLSIDASNGTATLGGTTLATFDGFEQIALGSGNDSYTGSGGSDNVVFGGGTDHIDGNDGDDIFYADNLAQGNSAVIDGGNGNDTLSFENVDGTVTAWLGESIISVSLNGGGEAYVTPGDIEIYRLTQGNDTFDPGNNGATVFGLGGDDVITCGDGTETIGFTGSAETLASLAASMGQDTINGFSAISSGGADSILLDGTALGIDSAHIATYTGSFDSDSLGVSGAAVFVYQDGADAKLYYTTDASQVTEENSYEFAVFTGSTVAASDISLTQEHQGG